MFWSFYGGGGGNIGDPPLPLFFLSFLILPPLTFNPGMCSNKLLYTTQVCFFLPLWTFKSLRVLHHANCSGKLFNFVHDCAYNAWIDFHPLHVAGIERKPALPKGRELENERKREREKERKREREKERKRQREKETKRERDKEKTPPRHPNVKPKIKC